MTTETGRDRKSQRAARQAGCSDILWDLPQTPEWKVQALRNPITASEKDLPAHTSNNSSEHPRLESAGAAALPNNSVLHRDLQPAIDGLNRVKIKSQVCCYIYSASGNVHLTIIPHLILVLFLKRISLDLVSTKLFCLT